MDRCVQVRAALTGLYREFMVIPRGFPDSSHSPQSSRIRSSDDGRGRRDKKESVRAQPLMCSQ